VNNQNMNIDMVKQIARNAGAAIMKIYGEDDFAVEYKSDTSPLTAADKAAHEVIVAGLQQHFPDIPILSEEGADFPYTERKTWERFWLVDPLDGTKEFIKRNGEFTVNIALIENQRPVLGVVYVPAQDKMYSGIAGEGAWLGEPKVQGTRCQDSGLNLGPETWNLSPLRVRSIEPEHGLTVVMSRSHPSPELEAYLKDINVAEALPVGSSLKLCVVAEGKADLYPRLGPTMEWDTAAGHAVVVAAGGTVATPEGEELLYNKEDLLNPYFIVEGTKG
jgi:3'(2'), 5'-bisphosphate nucleotidase